MPTILIDLLFMGVFTLILIAWIGAHITYRRMKRTEKRLLASNLGPSGSKLGCGIVRTKDSSGVEPDSQPTRSWYSVLAG